MKILTIKSGVNSTSVPDRFGAEVSQEARRLTGVTPRLLRSFQESPARLLPRVKGLRAAMGAKKVSVKVKM